MFDEQGYGVKIDDPDAVRAEWLDRLNALASQVKGWVEKHDWRTRLVSKPLRDGILGRFDVPLLLMERYAVQVALNPITRFPGNADGGVDLYIVPAYDEVAGILLEDGRWAIYYTFDRRADGKPIPEPECLPLSEETLDRVLNAMVARDTESI